MQVARLTELASGVDAIYLSGRALIGDALLNRLEQARALAESSDVPFVVKFGGVEFVMHPFNFGKYRFRLENHLAMIGVTSSKHLPAFRVQPRAEFIHGAGPYQVVEYFRELLQIECGIVALSVSRADLFADFQGWDLHGDDRRLFVCRAKSRAVNEVDEVFNGLRFGERSTGTVHARIYNKSIESEKTGSAYWKTIWAERYIPDLPVIRVEFELASKALRQFGIRSPEELLDAVGALWVNLTHEWLTKRTPTNDHTKSRWPLAPEWLDVQRASIAHTDWGIARIYDEQRSGLLANLLPGLKGYLTSYAALTNCDTLPGLLALLELELRDTEVKTGVSFTEQVRRRKQKKALQW